MGSSFCKPSLRRVTWLRMTQLLRAGPRKLMRLLKLGPLIGPFTSKVLPAAGLTTTGASPARVMGPFQIFEPLSVERLTRLPLSPPLVMPEKLPFAPTTVPPARVNEVPPAPPEDVMTIFVELPRPAEPTVRFPRFRLMVPLMLLLPNSRRLPAASLIRLPLPSILLLSVTVSVRLKSRTLRFVIGPAPTDPSASLFPTTTVPSSITVGPA